jgi:hypothetical protein
MTTREELLGLAGRVDAATLADNSLDVLVEIALFEPASDYSAVRANAAGTKVIYTRESGVESTFWAFDWTASQNKVSTIAALRARAAQIGGGS